MTDSTVTFAIWLASAVTIGIVIAALLSLAGRELRRWWPSRRRRRIRIRLRELATSLLLVLDVLITGDGRRA